MELVLTVMGMKCGDSVAKGFAADVCVNLGSRNTLMTKHFLYSTQIGTILHQIVYERN